MDVLTLKEYFEYEPDTGMLRRVKGGRVPYPWRKLGSNGRYLAVTFKGKTYYLHRLVWLWHHGRIPERIDHVSNDQSDNRIENLRACSSAQNQYNSKLKITSKSGVKGVVWCKGYRKPWRARLGRDGGVIELGRYGTKEEAADAYAAGAKQYAGEFARIE